MPKPFQYKEGSLVYCQGDVADKVLILQSGKVSLISHDIETGKDQREQVQPGEFFGVKSALGRFPREENAIAIEDSTVMTFAVPEFETVITANNRILMKMLKVFSNQMRRVHNQVSSLLEIKDVQPEKGLFSIGEKYMRNKNYPHAKYVFSRYLTYYPTGKDAEQAVKNLQHIEAAINGGAGIKRPPSPGR